MGEALPIPRLSSADYLLWEADQTEKHEWIDGGIVAMTGAPDAHNRIAGHLYVALSNLLRGSPCRTFMSDMKLHAETADAYFYPDVFVACDPRDRVAEADLVKRHPVFVAEVLSGSTAAYYRGRKFEVYRGIEGLQEVAFIEPDRAQVDLFRRNDEGLWVLHPSGPGQVLALQSVPLVLPLSQLYEDVLATGT